MMPGVLGIPVLEEHLAVEHDEQPGRERLRLDGDAAHRGERHGFQGVAGEHGLEHRQDALETGAAWPVGHAAVRARAARSS